MGTKKSELDDLKKHSPNINVIYPLIKKSSEEEGSVSRAKTGGVRRNLSNLANGTYRESVESEKSMFVEKDGVLILTHGYHSGLGVSDYAAIQKMITDANFPITNNVIEKLQNGGYLRVAKVLGAGKRMNFSEETSFSGVLNPAGMAGLEDNDVLRPSDEKLGLNEARIPAFGYIGIAGTKEDKVKLRELFTKYGMNMSDFAKNGKQVAGPDGTDQIAISKQYQTPNINNPDFNEELAGLANSIMSRTGGVAPLKVSRPPYENYQNEKYVFMNPYDANNVYNNNMITLNNASGLKTGMGADYDGDKTAVTGAGMKEVYANSMNAFDLVKNPDDPNDKGFYNYDVPSQIKGTVFEKEWTDLALGMKAALDGGMNQQKVKKQFIDKMNAIESVAKSTYDSSMPYNSATKLETKGAGKILAYNLQKELKPVIGATDYDKDIIPTNTNYVNDKHGMFDIIGEELQAFSRKEVNGLKVQRTASYNPDDPNDSAMVNRLHKLGFTDEQIRNQWNKAKSNEYDVTDFGEIKNKKTKEKSYEVSAGSTVAGHLGAVDSGVTDMDVITDKPYSADGKHTDITNVIALTEGARRLDNQTTGADLEGALAKSVGMYELQKTSTFLTDNYSYFGEKDANGKLTKAAQYAQDKTRWVSAYEQKNIVGIGLKAKKYLGREIPKDDLYYNLNMKSLTGKNDYGWRSTVHKGKLELQNQIITLPSEISGVLKYNGDQNDYFGKANFIMNTFEVAMATFVDKMNEKFSKDPNSIHGSWNDNLNLLGFGDLNRTRLNAIKNGPTSVNQIGQTYIDEKGVKHKKSIWASGTEVNSKKELNFAVNEAENQPAALLGEAIVTGDTKHLPKQLLSTFNLIKEAKGKWDWENDTTTSANVNAFNYKYKQELAQIIKQSKGGGLYNQEDITMNLYGGNKQWGGADAISGGKLNWDPVKKAFEENVKTMGGSIFTAIANQYIADGKMAPEIEKAIKEAQKYNPNLTFKFKNPTAEDNNSTKVTRDYINKYNQGKNGVNGVIGLDKKFAAQDQATEVFNHMTGKNLMWDVADPKLRERLATQYWDGATTPLTKENGWAYSDIVHSVLTDLKGSPNAFAMKKEVGKNPLKTIGSSVNDYNPTLTDFYNELKNKGINLVQSKKAVSETDRNLSYGMEIPTNKDGKSFISWNALREEPSAILNNNDRKARGDESKYYSKTAMFDTKDNMLNFFKSNGKFRVKDAITAMTISPNTEIYKWDTFTPEQKIAVIDKLKTLKENSFNQVVIGVDGNDYIKITSKTDLSFQIDDPVTKEKTWVSSIKYGNDFAKNYSPYISEFKSGNISKDELVDFVYNRDLVGKAQVMVGKTKLKIDDIQTINPTSGKPSFYVRGVTEKIKDDNGFEKTITKQVGYATEDEIKKMKKAAGAAYIAPIAFASQTNNYQADFLKRNNMDPSTLDAHPSVSKALNVVKAVIEHTTKWDDYSQEKYDSIATQYTQKDAKGNLEGINYDTLPAGFEDVTTPEAYKADVEKYNNSNATVIDKNPKLFRALKSAEVIDKKFKFPNTPAHPSANLISKVENKTSLIGSASKQQNPVNKGKAPEKFQSNPVPSSADSKAVFLANRAKREAGVSQTTAAPEKKNN